MSTQVVTAPYYGKEPKKVDLDFHVRWALLESSSHTRGGIRGDQIENLVNFSAMLAQVLYEKGLLSLEQISNSLPYDNVVEEVK